MWWSFLLFLLLWERLAYFPFSSISSCHLSAFLMTHMNILKLLPPTAKTLPSLCQPQGKRPKLVGDDALVCGSHGSDCLPGIVQCSFSSWTLIFEIGFAVKEVKLICNFLFHCVPFQGDHSR